MMGHFCSKRSYAADGVEEKKRAVARIESRTDSIEEDRVDGEKNGTTDEKHREDSGSIGLDLDSRDNCSEADDDTEDEYEYEAGSGVEDAEGMEDEDEEDSDVDEVNIPSKQDDLIGAGWKLWHEVTLIQIAVAEAYPTVNDSVMACEAHLMCLHAAAFKLHHKDFKGAGKPSQVDIGYHFTRSENIGSIDREGLLSRPDREKNDVKEAKYSGSAMGEGIYTCSDTSYAGRGQYGATGLLVARLRGVESSGNMCSGGTTHYDHHDTCVNGNVVVLHNSAQCMVLMQFGRELMDSSEGVDAVAKAHALLQKLMDSMFK